MSIPHWITSLLQPIDELPARAIKRERQPDFSANIVSKKDVYHHEREVLLLKSGQRVEDRALESLVRQGIPVLDCCAVKQPDGSLTPIEPYVLNGIVARVERATQNRAWAERMSDKLSVGNEDKIMALTHKASVNAPVGTMAWQRHFKVLVVSESKAVHERLAKCLQAEGVLSQHIRPILNHASFEYIYNKYAPTCLVLDDDTHHRFIQQGVDVLALCEMTPKGLEHIIMMHPEESVPVPPRPFMHFTVHHLQLPIRRKDVHDLITPMTNAIKRIYSEAATVKDESVKPT